VLRKKMLRVSQEEFVPRKKQKLPVVFNNPAVNWGFFCQPIIETSTYIVWYPPQWLWPDGPFANGKVKLILLDGLRRYATLATWWKRVSIDPSILLCNNKIKSEDDLLLSDITSAPGADVMLMDN
jgi:hypothetical protein